MPDYKQLRSRIAVSWAVNGVLAKWLLERVGELKLIIYELHGQVHLDLLRLRVIHVEDSCPFLVLFGPLYISIACA